MPRKPAPFAVWWDRDVGKWMLVMVEGGEQVVGWFNSQATAINHAYRNWPYRL